MTIGPLLHRLVTRVLLVTSTDFRFWLLPLFAFSGEDGMLIMSKME